MSIELLPADLHYPSAYHVRPNYCRCHPETCCCDDWAVHDAEGEKFSTHYSKARAQQVAEALNKPA